MIDEKDLAYIAGFMDAEGTVALTRTHGSKYRAPHVTIPNTEKSILQWIVTRLPNGAAISSKKVYQEHHKQGYVLAYRYDAALEVLGKILNYMKHPKKKARARFLLNHYKRVTKRNGKYNEKEKTNKLDFESVFFAIS